MARLGYFFIAFPYLFGTPFFLGIQPWALIVCASYLLFNYKNISLNFSQIIFSFLSLFLFLTGILMIQNLSYGLLVSLICPITFILFYNLTHEKLTLNFLNIVLSIYFIFGFLYIIAPEIFTSFHKLLLSQYRVEFAEHRGTGAAFFAPEPGLGAGILSMITFAWLLRLPKKKTFQHLATFILICLCIFLTRSGTGYLFFFFIVAYYIFKLSDSKLATTLLSAFIIFLISSSIFFLYIYGFFENNHGFKALAMILSGDIRENSSVGIRLWSTIDAFNEMRVYELGNIERMMNGVDNIKLLNPGYPTNIARLVYAFGYFGILYYFLLYHNLNTTFQLKILALFSVSILFPISTPAIVFFLNKKIS
jgi:hypothetical protein